MMHLAELLPVSGPEKPTLLVGMGILAILAPLAPEKMASPSEPVFGGQGTGVRGKTVVDSVYFALASPSSGMATRCTYHPFVACHQTACCEF